MKTVRELLLKYNLKLLKYSEIYNIKIVETDKGKFLLKKSRQLDKNKRFNYLSSRSFDYYVRPINDVNDEYEIYPFIEQINVINEEKAIDIINLMSLLHNKTTIYNDIDLDSVKEIYENINKQLDYLYKYYYTMQDMIEMEVYMAPNTYYLISNISHIYSCLDYCKDSINKWYNLLSDKKKVRSVLLHNNLNLTHILENKDNRYLISWDKSIVGNPIYDFYNFYNNNYKDIDFISLFKIYIHKYPLTEEEKLLLFVLLSIPKKIIISNDIIKNCREIEELFLKLDKTHELILNNRPKQEEKKTN